ncbi:DUF6912 family protein [Corynebacterium diphtheriae]|uniref:Uncharacterized protein n=1 Tax=Corynebacterium diphtheriae bv. gravis TaxID=1720349 RepID=A0AAX0J435_CORDP|nr:hypothetical protein [Corynebacterium diphtheriae]ERA58032.1 hypothetical protein B178_02946 [Corynebacterium diphtheriae DSM 43988]AEX66853.1 hypothetical protein CDC7B_0656 [Corynebacterium diphtheriae C7 (beta)]OKY24020.1 hypothetical protein AOT42_01740 [Corynebacterium diphtheriae bv. gravis]UEB36252.1 hypothetical protein LK418_05635 [Corynebacterium diphtheriae subsp. diphtheriae]UEB41467.1 hypothetical protein LK405_01665 [Corynebacterium diphtheriae]
MRVYLPATFSMLQELDAQGSIVARSGYGFAVTPALRDFYTAGDEEEIAESAFEDAALASIRLLAIGDQEAFPYRRVVVSVDVPDEVIILRPDLGESVVVLDPAVVGFDSVAAIHVDVEGSEAATAKAIEVIDAADLGDEDAELAVGDALDNFLAWYDPSELSALVDLL